MIKKKSLRVTIIAIAFLVMPILIMSCSADEQVIYSCTESNEYFNDVEIADEHETRNEIDMEQNWAVNQYNNRLLSGFVLMLGEDIYFADAVGIHKTDKTFSHIKTLVHNDNYHEFLLGNRAAFTNLHYYAGRIFFRDMTGDHLIMQIYSMNPNGSDLRNELNVDIADMGFSDHFLAANDKIYYVRHGFLKAFDLQTRDTIELGIDRAGGGFLTITPCGDALQFLHSYNNVEGIGLLNFYDYSLTFFRPLNLTQTRFDDDFVSFIPFITGNEKLAFIDWSMQKQSRIFVVNEDGYAEVIYQNTGEIDLFINSINEWIYFTLIPEDNSVHLYRIKYDGSFIDRIFENVTYHNDYMRPRVFINILSEDLIFITKQRETHFIYAITLDESTNDFVMKLINPVALG